VASISPEPQMIGRSLSENGTGTLPTRDVDETRGHVAGIRASEVELKDLAASDSWPSELGSPCPSQSTRVLLCSCGPSCASTCPCFCHGLIVGSRPPRPLGSSPDVAPHWPLSPKKRQAVKDQLRALWMLLVCSANGGSEGSISRLPKPVLALLLEFLGPEWRIKKEKPPPVVERVPMIQDLSAAMQDLDNCSDVTTESSDSESSVVAWMLRVWGEGLARAEVQSFLKIRVRSVPNVLRKFPARGLGLACVTCLSAAPPPLRPPEPTGGLESFADPPSQNGSGARFPPLHLHPLAPQISLRSKRLLPAGGNLRQQNHRSALLAFPRLT